MAASALPDWSSASRIAATWPSIIPDGAITSAPALGLGDRDRRVALERGVVVDLAGVGEQPAVAVVGVLVEAVVGHEDQRVAHLVAQVAQRHLHDAVGVVGAASRGRPSPRGRRRGSPRGRRGRRGRGPPCAGSPGCAAPRRASRRSAPARRGPPSRRGARPGRRPRAGPRRRAGAARASGAAGAGAEQGTARHQATAALAPFGVATPRHATGQWRQNGRGGWRRGRRWCAARLRRRRGGRVAGGVGRDRADRDHDRDGSGRRVDRVEEVVDRRRRRERDRVDAALGDALHQSRDRARRARCGTRGAPRPRSRARQALGQDVAGDLGARQEHPRARAPTARGTPRAATRPRSARGRGRRDAARRRARARCRVRSPRRARRPARGRRARRARGRRRRTRATPFAEVNTSHAYASGRER